MFQIRRKVLGDKKRRSGRKTRPGLRVIRPHLEALEDRLAPTVFNVNTTAEPVGVVNLTTGTDSTGHVTLRGAIAAANHLGSGNTINVPAGTYNLKFGQMDIRNNLTITGAALTGSALNGTLAPSTIINAGLSSRIYQIFNGFTVTISNVTLEEGVVMGTSSTPGQGGAIFDSGALTLKNDSFFENFTEGAPGAGGAPGANGVNESFPNRATAGGPGGNGQPGGDAEGGAIYLDNAPGAAMSILNCALNNNFAFQGRGGNGGQGGIGGSTSGSAPAGGAGGNGGSGGNAFGGGLYVAGGSLSIQNSVFAGNSAGISSFFGLFSVVGGGSGGAGGSGGKDRGDLNGGQGGNGGSGGSAGDDSGGAIYNSANGAVAISDCSFVDNTAFGENAGPGGVGGSGGFNNRHCGPGGAGGTGGSAGGGTGGAIDNFGTMKIDDSSFFSNQAIAAPGGSGGAGGTGGGTGKTNDEQGGNGGNGGNGGFGGTGVAGGIDNISGSLTLSHDSISLNAAGSGAGGTGGAGGAGGLGLTNGTPGSAGSAGTPGHALTGGLLSGFQRPQVFDTIIAGDTAPVDPDVNGFFTSLGHNLIGVVNGSSGFGATGDQVGTSTNPINPQLSVAGNFLVPQVGSPALQAGDPTNAPASDERGLPRIVDDDANYDSDGPQMDIGAVEFQASDPGVSEKASSSQVGPGGTLTYTLTLAVGKGDNPVLNLALTDPLPAHTTFKSFTAPAGWIVSAPAVGATGTVTATFPTPFPTNTKVSFTLVIKVDTTAPNGAVLTNTVSMTTTSPDPTLSDNTATVNTTVVAVGWLAVAADAGGSPDVQVFNAQTGVLKFDLVPFGASFQGGIRVAVGDVNGDGIADIITAEGPGGTGLVRVFDGITGQLLAGPLGSFQPFGPDYTGGIYVAAGDINGDGHADVVTGEDEGGEPRIKVFSGQDGSVLADFLAFAAGFQGGVRVAAADVNHNGAADVVASAGPGSPPLVEVFEGKDLVQGITTPTLSFDAFDPSLQGGVYVATGNVHGDGIPKIITGEGAGGEPRVSVFDGITGAQLQTFLAFQPGFRGGVRVAAADVNGDGRPDLIAAEGAGGLPQVRGFDGLSLEEIYHLRAFDSRFRGGVFVGGGGQWPVLHPAPTEQDDHSSGAGSQQAVTWPGLSLRNPGVPDRFVSPTGILDDAWNGINSVLPTYQANRPALTGKPTQVAGGLDAFLANWTHPRSQALLGNDTGVVPKQSLETSSDLDFWSSIAGSNVLDPVIV